MPLELADGCNVDNLLCVSVQRKAVGDLPHKDAAVVGGRGQDMVVERVPVGVEHGRRVAAEEGDLVGDLAALVDGDDGECATAAGLPIDREVLGVGLCCCGSALKRRLSIKDRVSVNASASTSASTSALRPTSAQNGAQHT